MTPHATFADLTDDEVRHARDAVAPLAQEWELAAQFVEDANIELARRRLAKP